MSADKLLTDAAQIMQERAKQYDSPTGERSMGKAVSAFNCVTGNKMTEAEGWLLLQLLKDVRQWTTPQVAHVDSLQDCIAYAALKAECIIEKTASDAEWQDKELASSGLYPEREGKESFTPNDGKRVWVGKPFAPINYGCTAGYSADDLQAASLVHDAELDADLVSLCSNTEIHADKDGWIEHHGNECPVSDGRVKINIKNSLNDRDVEYVVSRADFFNWRKDEGCQITHWRYANKES